jgi:hypothetical protein
MGSGNSTEGAYLGPKALQGIAGYRVYLSSGPVQGDSADVDTAVGYKE